jgi:hypothetical protein
VPNATEGSRQARSALTWRRLLIGVGIAAGMLFGALAAIVAISGPPSVGVDDRATTTPPPAGGALP